MKPICSKEPNRKKCTKLQRPRLKPAEATNKESETERKGEGFGRDALCLSQRERDKGQCEERRVNLEKWWNAQLLDIQDSTTGHLKIRRGEKKEEKVKDDRLLGLKFG